MPLFSIFSKFVDGTTQTVFLQKNLYGVKNRCGFNPGFLLIVIAALLCGSCADNIRPDLLTSQRSRQPEKFYQQRWCTEQMGQMEVVIRDPGYAAGITRCDCLTATHAVEFDFAPKWAEAVGQALYYGAITGKKPAVVLIHKGGQVDERYNRRISTILDAYGITMDVWQVK
jgi:hypothetical protein